MPQDQVQQQCPKWKPSEATDHHREAPPFAIGAHRQAEEAPQQQQRQEWKPLEVTKHRREAPRFPIGAHRQAAEAPQPQFAQPVNIQGAAPAPEMAGQAQQQQLSRKERWKQERKAAKQEKAEEKQRQKEAKRMAAAKVQVDKLVQQMRDNPIPGQAATDYAGMRPTETFSDKGEYLERVILTQIQDEWQARELLTEVRTFMHHAEIFDKAIQDFRFRQQNVPVYIEDVLHQQVSEDVTELLQNESVKFSNAAYGEQIKNTYKALDVKVFGYLTREQEEQATTRSMRKGEAAQAYRQAIEQRMQQDHIGRNEAARRYAEDALRQKRPVTLRKLEEQRKAHRGEKSFQRMEEGFQSVTYANVDIQRAHPGAPTLNWDTASDLAAEYIRDATKNISYQMRVPNCQIMNLILDAGRFKTQMETNSTKGALNLDMRKQFTKASFGVDPETLPPDQFEIYGYASHGDLVKESQANSEVGQGVGQYGQVVVTLKKDSMRNRTTMLIGDSLSARSDARVNWVDQPDLHAVTVKSRLALIDSAYEHHLRKAADPNHETDLEDLLRDAQASYAELQYHGGVRVEDIESVTLIADYIAEDGVEVEREMPQELVDRLKALGIRAKIVKEGREHEL